MNYEKINMNGYNIHIIKTNKFKTTTISINFREKIINSNITKRNFLFDFLTSSSKKYNTERLLEIELENLYSLTLNSLSTKFGNTINSYIDIKFLNEKYSDKNLLNQSLDLLYELIFNPNINNNLFDEKTFNRIYKENELLINSKKENTNRYANIRALELMDNNDPISYDMYGNIKDLNLITPSNLYDYYINVLNTNKIDIFIIGNINKKEIINYFNNKFLFKERGNSDIESYINYSKYDNTKIVNEKMNILQSRLSIILKAINITDFERRYVMPIYTSILGGSSNSRLFMNIREHESLTYNINAYSKMPNSIIIINAGIDLSNYKRTIDLIKNEIDNMKSITKEELDNAKNDMIVALNSLFDNQKDIINYYLGLEVFKSDVIDKKIENYKKVSQNDIINFSNKLCIAIIYLLGGEKDAKESN